LRIAAIGDVDELNAALGVARTACEPGDLYEILGDLQNSLFDVGAELACPDGLASGTSGVGESNVRRLEDSMDEMTEELPPLKDFILPGGTALAASLHLARCVCRRAERSILALDGQEPIRADVLRFVNRLSDWLFVAARTSNARSNVDDVIWRKPEHV
jgi:cob(I)alamin adenosyltransferase